MNCGRRPIRETNLSVLYQALGDVDKSLATAREAMRLSPDAISYANLCHSYVTLNRLDEAKATAAEAQARNLDAPYLHNDIYAIAFLQHEAAAMDREIKILATRGGFEDDSLATEAGTFAYFGQLTKALEINQRAVDAALRREAKDRAVDNKALFALWEAFSGNFA